jgi:small-conductance mechanosensitive channel
MIEVAPAEQHIDLTVHNRFITTLRATILEAPPKARAEAVIEALKELAKQGRIAPIETFPLDQGILFVVADRPIFAITHKDLNLITGESLEERASEARINLDVALKEMVELHNPENIVEGIASVLVAFLLFAIVFLVLQRLNKLIDQKILPSLDERLRASISKRLGESAERELRFLNFLRALLTTVLWSIFFVVAYLWLTYSLEQFPYTRPWGESLGQKLLDLLSWVVDGIARAIPGLFVVLIILFLTRVASRLIRALFEGIESGRLEIPGLHPETAQPTRRIVTAALWLLALVVAYPYFPGSSTAAFKGLSVFAGLVISLGSTGIVNQAMSGLMLMYARALRPGDFVHIGSVQGTVTHLGMLSTKVRSLKNEEITVPNAVVISRETTNYSRFEREGVAITTTVTIGYDTPWRTVQALLVEAAGETEGLRKEPQPFVLQTALSDYYPEYKLLAVIDQPAKRGLVLSVLHQNIQDLFHRNGIQIMSPHYVADPPEPKLGAPDAT